MHINAYNGKARCSSGPRRFVNAGSKQRRRLQASSRIPGTHSERAREQIGTIRPVEHAPPDDAAIIGIRSVIIR